MSGTMGWLCVWETEGYSPDQVPQGEAWAKRDLLVLYGILNMQQETS